MTLQAMSFIFGAILLAVAILGGGFEIKEIKVSQAVYPAQKFGSPSQLPTATSTVR